MHPPRLLSLGHLVSLFGHVNNKQFVWVHVIMHDLWSLFLWRKVYTVVISEFLCSVFIFRLKEHISNPSNNPILIFPEGNVDVIDHDLICLVYGC